MRRYTGCGALDDLSGTASAVLSGNYSYALDALPQSLRSLVGQTINNVIGSKQPSGQYLLPPGTTEPAYRNLPLAPFEMVPFAKSFFGQYGMFLPSTRTCEPVLYGEPENCWDDPNTTPYASPTDLRTKYILGQLAQNAMTTRIKYYEGNFAHPDRALAVGWVPSDLTSSAAPWNNTTRNEATRLFNAFRAWSPLPEDAQYEDNASQPWFGWPSGNDHTTREIYQWTVDNSADPPRVGQLMQVQKFTFSRPWSNTFEGKWLIYNANAVDLMFHRWNGGDFTTGDLWNAWWSQNGQKVLDAFLFIAKAVAALAVNIVSLGSASPLFAMGAMALQFKAAVEAATVMAQAIQKGDLGAAFQAFLAAASAFVGIMPGGMAEFTQKMQEEFDGFMQSPVMMAMTKVVADIQDTDVFKLVEDGINQAKSLAEIGVRDFELAINSLPLGLSRYAWMGWDAGIKRAELAAERALAPWYALGAFDLGVFSGSVAQAQRPGDFPEPLIHAARMNRSVVTDPAMAHVSFALAENSKAMGAPAPVATAPAEAPGKTALLLGGGALLIGAGATLWLGRRGIKL